jgi:carbon monoxide dehydrogenase subunit G
MLLNLTKELPLNSPIDEVCKLLRDPPRLTGLLSGVENVTTLNDESVEAYAAKVAEKVGPFKITSRSGCPRLRTLSRTPPIRLSTTKAAPSTRGT